MNNGYTDGAGAADLHELAALYAVDALEPAERAAFEKHLARCPQCREEVAGYAEASEHLASAAAAEPPAELRASVLSAIHGIRPGTDSRLKAVPAEEPAAPPGNRVSSLQERRQRRNRRLLAAAAAAVLMPGIAVAGWSLGADQERQQQEQAAAQEQQRENRLLTAADVTAESVDVNGEPATLVYSREQDSALFVASGLPDPGTGKEYQLWLLDDGAALPDVRFSGGAVRTWLTGDLVPAGGAALTIEPEGGSATPTFPLIAAVEFPES